MALFDVATWRGRIAAILLCGLLAAAAACGGDDDATPSPQPQASPSPASPTVTAATPQPEREVRAGGYTLVDAVPAANFTRMVAYELIPGDDRAVVLTQEGVIYAVGDAEGSAETFLDIRDRIKRNLDNEEGLLGIAFAPDFETSREFYIYYSKDDPRRTTLSRFRAPGDTADPASEQVLLDVEQPYRNHNGGALAFGPDGMLYVGLGDGGSGGDPQGNAQNTQTLLGSILRIDVSGGAGYTIPPDNPFVGGGGRPEIFAYGFRNPWRFSFDTQTGALWAGDVGQDAVEEVDLIERGKNYGWNIMEGSSCFRAAACDTAGLTLPRAEYTHEFGCSVTGGRVYRGSAMPELVGWYVYADYCSGNVWAFDTADPASEPLLIAETGLQISSFGVDADGELLLVTFANRIGRLARAD